MDHILLPLEHLRQEVDFFVREESLRLLHIVADSALHGPALDALRAMQWSPDNRRLVLVLEDPDGQPSSRWDVWNEYIRKEYANIREAYAKVGIELGELGPSNDGEPLIRFAAALKAASDVLGQAPARSNGITVIFSTATLRDPDQWISFLVEIVSRTPSLANIRWGWMETGKTIGSELASALGKERVLHVECRVDPARQREELEDLLSSMVEADDEATGPAAVGAAAPTVAPPTHPTDPPRQPAPSVARQVNRLLLKGVQAVRAGDMKEAIRLQSLAFQQCASADAASLAVEMELLLATYVVQAAGGEEASLRSALSIFQRVSARAYQNGLIVAGAKTDIILAPLAKLVGEFEMAGQVLRRVADRARTTAPPLSIEALRLAADFMAERGNSTKARGLLEEALEIATDIPSTEARQTSASACATGLAAILRREGHDSQAAEVEASAQRWNVGTSS